MAVDARQAAAPLLDILTSLRSLDSAISECVAELNEIWRQICAVERTNLALRDSLSALLRVNLTESMGKMQVAFRSDKGRKMIVNFRSIYLHSIATKLLLKLCLRICRMLRFLALFNEICTRFATISPTHTAAIQRSLPLFRILATRRRKKARL